MSELTKNKIREMKKMASRLKAYGFWMWEYQRRNSKYQNDFDKLTKLIEKAQLPNMLNQSTGEKMKTLHDMSIDLNSKKNMDLLSEDMSERLNTFSASENANMFLFFSKTVDDNLERSKALKAYTSFLSNHWREPKDYREFMNKYGKTEQYIDSDSLLDDICNLEGDYGFEIDIHYDPEIAWRRNDESSFKRIGKSTRDEDFYYTAISSDKQIDTVLENIILSFCSEYLTHDDFMQIYDLNFDQLSNEKLAYQYLSALDSYRIKEQMDKNVEKQHRLYPRYSMSRAVGLWTYDYIVKEKCDLKTAHEALCNLYFDCIKDTGQWRRDRVKMELLSTIACIEQVRILPMGYSKK